MRKNKVMKRFKSIAMAALAVVITVSSAISTQPVSAQSSAALSIVPKKNYTVEPGKTIKDKLTIRNLDNEKTLELTLRVVDFTFTDDSGTPKLFLDEDAPQTTWSLKPYLSVPKTAKIPPRDSKTLDMSLNIPKGHGAGSYYSAIVYSSGAPDGGNVGLSASGVSLVFAQIPGKVNEDLKLEKFGAYTTADGEKKGGYQFLMLNEPQNMAYTLKNNGNVTEAPAGSITLNHMFGLGGPVTINDVNPNDSLALIGQSRTYTACMKLKTDEVDFNGSKTPSKSCTTAGLWPGLYTATINLYYGQNGNRTQEIAGTSIFIYLPVWFIIVLLITILLIAYGIWRLRNFIQRKRYGSNYRKPKKSARKK